MMKAYAIELRRGEETWTMGMIAESVEEAEYDCLKMYENTLEFNEIKIIGVTLYVLRPAIVEATYKREKFEALYATGSGFLFYVRDDKKYIARCKREERNSYIYCTIFNDDHKIHKVPHEQMAKRLA